MSEDFGWAGDEFMLGDCQDDWMFYMADRFDSRKGQRELAEIQRQHADELALEYLELDDDDAPEGCDIPTVGEYEEWDCSMYDGED